MSDDVNPDAIRAYFQASLLVREMFYNSHRDAGILAIVLKVAADWGLNWQVLYERVWDLALLEG